MKIVTFARGDKISAGCVEQVEVVVCGDGAGAVQALIERGDAGIAAWTEAGAVGAPRVKLTEVTLRAPIPEPRRDIICVGKNYHAHAEELHTSGFDSNGKETVPTAPIIFTKATTTAVWRDAIVRDRSTLPIPSIMRASRASSSARAPFR